MFTRILMVVFGLLFSLSGNVFASVPDTAIRFMESHKGDTVSHIWAVEHRYFEALGWDINDYCDAFREENPEFFASDIRGCENEGFRRLPVGVIWKIPAPQTAQKSVGEDAELVFLPSEKNPGYMIPHVVQKTVVGASQEQIVAQGVEIAPKEEVGIPVPWLDTSHQTGDTLSNETTGPAEKVAGVMSTGVTNQTQEVAKGNLTPMAVLVFMAIMFGAGFLLAIIGYAGKRSENKELKEALSEKNLRVQELEKTLHNAYNRMQDVVNENSQHWKEISRLNDQINNQIVHMEAMKEVCVRVTLPEKPIFKGDNTRYTLKALGPVYISYAKEVHEDSIKYRLLPPGIPEGLLVDDLHDMSKLWKFLLRDTDTAGFSRKEMGITVVEVG